MVENLCAFNLGELDFIEPWYESKEDREIDHLLPLFVENATGDSPFMMPDTVYCVGANYKSFTDEAGIKLPKEPLALSRPATVIAYHGDDIVVPEGWATNDADYEAHLAVIIDKECKNVGADEAMKFVVGITAASLIVARRHPSKSFDGSCRLASVIVNEKYIDNWSNIEVVGELNDEVVQRATLAEMAFSIPEIISSLSRRNTLKPGTIILTGTPAGTGWYRKPKSMLKNGDTFRVKISHGVGSVINKVRFSPELQSGPQAEVELVVEVESDEESNVESNQGSDPVDLSRRPAAPRQRFVRYLPEDAHPYEPDVVRLGQPADPNIDVGQALADGAKTLVYNVWGWDVAGARHDTWSDWDEYGYIDEIESLFWEPEEVDDETMTAAVVYCIGNNYKYHGEGSEASPSTAAELSVAMKPATALAHHGNYLVVPKSFAEAGVDCQAHVAIIIAEDCKNVDEDEAMDYVLGFAAGSNISSRKTTWRSFDHSCALGPVLVDRDAVEGDDWSKITVQGKLNGEVVQSSSLADMRVSIPEIISFLSQGTTLAAGTVILTGTPMRSCAPNDGDIFTVTVSHGAGSLINEIQLKE